MTTSRSYYFFTTVRREIDATVMMTTADSNAFRLVNRTRGSTRIPRLTDKRLRTRGIVHGGVIILLAYKRNKQCASNAVVKFLCVFTVKYC